MGWLLVGSFASLTLFLLYASGRCSRLALEVAAAALLFGIAGYGWQGSPDMLGSPLVQNSR
jgi:hypothetical protein